MRYRFCALLLLVLASPASSTPAITLDEILARNAEALGGDAAFARIENLRFALAIREPAFEVNATYVATRDGRMRIDIEMDGERVFSEGLDDGVAWQWSPDAGVTESSAAGAAALRHGIESPGRFWTLQQLRARGARMELVEPGPLAQPHEWQLRLTLDDGAVIDWFIDRTSYLPTREISRRAFHPDADATEVLIETVHSDPVTVDGVLRLRHSEQRNLDTGEWLGTTEVRAMEHNIELPEAYFRRK